MPEIFLFRHDTGFTSITGNDFIHLRERNMVTKISILAAYFLVVLVIGFVARTKWKSTPATYFLADRKLGALVLLGTMVATNFSAFTVFGTSGAGYRDGYAFFPIMGFGTGFMALTFWILGKRVMRIGREKGLVTPPELLRETYQSKGLSFLASIVMIIFTIPYLALQPMAAGYALEELIGLPYIWGAALVTVIIVLYTFRGGMRAVAWTDLFQGLLMFVLLLVSLFIVAGHFGGFAQANGAALEKFPELFSRPGASGRYTLGIWFSYIFLWFFCDPMFPQLFQRFYTAKSEKTLGKIMLFYPFVCSIVFILPISIGVMGKLAFPDLVGKDADRILPMVMTQFSGDAMAALVMAAGLAALMSTMDSQLLTLSSIFTRDIMPLSKDGRETTSLGGRIFVVCLSACGFLLAINPPDTILKIATQTFTGLAVLFPAFLFCLYMKKVYPLAGILSIITGETLVVLYYFKMLPAGPFLPVVWVMLSAFGVYIIVHTALSVKETGLAPMAPKWLLDPYFLLFTALFLLGMDYWAWGSRTTGFLGYPVWIGYFLLLSVAQTVLMALWVRRGEEPETAADVNVGRTNMMAE